MSTAYNDINNAFKSNQYDPLQYAKFGRVGNSEDGQAFERVQETDQAIQVDDAGTYVYVGFAIAGTATSGATWKLMRITSASGSLMWADGNAYYDNVFDDRASKSYS